MANRRRDAVQPGPCYYDEKTMTWSCWPANSQPGQQAPRADTASPSSAHVDVFRIVTDHFRLDIVAFWTHSTVYIVLQGALFTVFATTVGPQAASAGPGLVPTHTMTLWIAMLGVFFAGAWFLTSMGRRKLIDAWRKEVLHHEGHVSPVHRSYARVEETAVKMWYEPTRVTVIVPLVLGLVWLGVIIWLVG